METEKMASGLWYTLKTTLRSTLPTAQTTLPPPLNDPIDEHPGNPLEGQLSPPTRPPRLSRDRTQEQLQEVYDRDPISGAFIIDVALSHYSDLFNAWDYSPFRRRDLNPELRSFLSTCASDIPLRYPLTLRFCVLKEYRNLPEEQAIQRGLKSHYGFTSRILRQELGWIQRRAIGFIALGLLIMAISIRLEPRETPKMVMETLAQGFSVGGWVFLWEGITALTLGSGDLRQQLRIQERFLNAVAIFRYGSDDFSLQAPDRDGLLL
ncbi:MAG: hypothetical protein VKK80_13650 [Prochlorothrix sp.]|nr:hypothetical protein [Prochlorothrix sp.]